MPPIDPDKTAIARLSEARYPFRPPFCPTADYPELPSHGEVASGPPNLAYDAVRSVLQALELDAENIDTPRWNPLGDLIRRGDHVVVKPNLICQENWSRPGSWEEVITHPSIIRAVVDYVLLALGGTGRVTIADGPQTDSDFDLLVSRSGLGALVGHYRKRGLPVELLDLRRERWFTRGEVTVRKEKLRGDPAGYVTVDLGENSAFRSYGLSGAFYGADYDMAETRRFHSEGRHEYIVCATPMRSDVFINLPKLKTHKKTGVTLSLKNLVGINGYRNCLPHHTVGSPSDRGDEFPDGGVKRKLESGSIRAFKRALASTGGTGGAWARWIKQVGRRIFGDTSQVVRSGNWSGNDTTWRMVMDLNQILLWHDEEGRRRPEPRRYFSLVDGIIGGEGNGPLAPEPVPSGFVAAGTSPWLVDRAATAEMGLVVEAIPMLHKPLVEEELFFWLHALGNETPPVIVGGERGASWRPFVPHFGWNTIAGAGATGVPAMAASARS